MKQFFEQCLRDLEALTGKRQVYYWQTETDTDSSGKAKGARKFEVCVQGMVIQSQNFPYIPEEDQKRIITEMIVKDQDYEALNSSVIYKWLAMYKDKYFMAANAPEPKPMHQHTPEELERIDKLAQEYLAQLAGAFQPSFKGIEKDMEAIKREDAERIKKKAISENRKINEEHIRQREKLAEISKERGLDKLGLHEIDKYVVEGKYIVARNLQEAREIYIEVYES
jgi:hypothetical protein